MPLYEVTPYIKLSKLDCIKTLILLPSIVYCIATVVLRVLPTYTCTCNNSNSLVHNSLLPTNYCVTSYLLQLRFARTSHALRSVLPTNYRYASFPIRCVLPTNYFQAYLAPCSVTTATLCTQFVVLLSFLLPFTVTMKNRVSLRMLSAVDKSHFREVQDSQSCQGRCAKELLNVSILCGGGIAPLVKECPSL